MSIEETNFKDLNALELNKLKDLYIESKVNNTSEEELKNLFKISISDQIKGTVGNQEEKEAWMEMKEYFKDDFEAKVLCVRKENLKDSPSIEIEEFEKRKVILENRNTTNDSKNDDMW